MASPKPNTLGSERPRLVQAVMDAYLRWRDECDELSVAYGRWSVAEGADAALAFEDYSAALDREERVAETYAGLIRRAREHRAFSPNAPGPGLLERTGQEVPAWARW
jgi:hypothetical protein